MITVFYGNQVFNTYASLREMGKDLYPHTDVQMEVYNSGYLFHQSQRKWYRCDLTPCLIEDVPKRLRMLQLVLNL